MEVGRMPVILISKHRSNNTNELYLKRFRQCQGSTCRGFSIMEWSYLWSAAPLGQYYLSFFLESSVVGVQSRAWLPIGCVAAERIFNVSGWMCAQKVVNNWAALLATRFMQMIQTASYRDFFSPPVNVGAKNNSNIVILHRKLPLSGTLTFILPKNPQPCISFLKIRGLRLSKLIVLWMIKLIRSVNSFAW